MSYFRINLTGCQEHKGLCEVRYDLYLSRTDEGNEEHYVTVPVFPPEGYTGEKSEMGQPVDMEAYNSWVASLPTETRNNPFCCHFCQFEPTVTDEEILFVGELALDMGIRNWATRELSKNKNAPAVLLSRVNYDIAKSVVTAEKSDPTAERESLDTHLEDAIVKIKECEARMSTIHATDFVAVEKTVETSYSIRG